MNLQELGERRKRFIRDCMAAGMSRARATCEENWKRFKHYCETGELLDPPDRGPLAVRFSSATNHMPFMAGANQ